MGGIPCGMERVRHDKEWLAMERLRLERLHLEHDREPALRETKRDGRARPRRRTLRSFVHGVRRRPPGSAHPEHALPAEN